MNIPYKSSMQGPKKSNLSFLLLFLGTGILAGVPVPAAAGIGAPCTTGNDCGNNGRDCIGSPGNYSSLRYACYQNTECRENGIFLCPCTCGSGNCGANPVGYGTPCGCGGTVGCAGCAN